LPEGAQIERRFCICQKTAQYQTEHEELFVAIRKDRPINDASG
jgi:hypothetical protein